MRKYRFGITYWLAALLVVFVTGCGQETVNIPGVVSVTPAQGATGVLTNTTVTATFNMAMSPASITSAGTFTVAGPGGAVTGAVTYSGVTATFTPAAALATSTTYTAKITTAAATPGGAELVSDYVWTFTTLAATPRVVPFVSSVTPAPFADPVALNVTISATFSQPMSCASLQTAFTVTAPMGDVAVTGATPPVTCVLNGSGNTVATFGGALPSYGTTYTATISTGATDTAGIAMAGAYVWTFTTLTQPPPPAPTVTSTIPANAATLVPINLQIISAAFSEPMNPNTIVRANFTLTYLVGSVINTVTGGTVAYAAGGAGGNLVFVLPPASTPLLPSTAYTATISNGVTDVAGTALNGGVVPTVCATSTGGNCVWTFTTGTAPPVNTPELVSTVPASGATGVCPLQAVSATFSEAMNPLTLSTSSTSSTTFLLYTGTAASGTPIAGKYSYDQANFIATFTPTNPLTLDTSYTATVTDGATDVFGDPLGTTGPPNPWTFKTVTTDTPSCQQPVTLGPTITPFGGFSGTAGMTNTGLTTVIHGDSGTTATGFSSYTGFHDNTVLPVDSYAGSTQGCTYTETTANVGLVTGTIYSPIVPNGSCPEGSAADIAIADEALAEATTAYTTLTGLPSSGALAGQIGHTTIYPGVWTTSGPVLITAGDVTLDAKGDPNARFVFQIGTILTVGLPATPCNVILKGGAKASNIFWVVEGTGVYLEPSGGGTFEGTIIATNFIHVSTAGYVNPVTVNGRLISLNASTTLVDTVINVPTP